ncbi:hypothetical protein [Simkania negevensis]|uniref:Uncharacterized protein n=1 Tax=Simkania negevensis (strain ATCC VR-1471 / DSM 27360 / Z) TaxID=331113 RepID=F8L597_SIMNZ|nr:hypothetical protein [Simkania negevensis]CCB87980.1 unknown protein [Simkania negevensis Z]
MISIDKFLNLVRSYDNLLWGIGVIGTVVILWFQVTHKKKKAEKSKQNEVQSQRDKYDY